jgi:hypothetical protein
VDFSIMPLVIDGDHHRMLRFSRDPPRQSSGNFIRASRTPNLNSIKLAICLLGAQSCSAATVLYDNAPFPAGGRGETSLTEQGFFTTGHFTHSGTQVSGRSSDDSTGFLSLINGDQLTIRSTSGALFDAVSIDLAEYSDVFRFAAKCSFPQPDLTDQPRPPLL